jgi:hypothetical protein
MNMKTGNIKGFMVREVGHLILQYSWRCDRKIVAALLKHSDRFNLHFYKPPSANLDDKAYLRFTFWTDSLEMPEVDTQFDYTMKVSDADFGILKAAFVEVLGRIWYVKDDLNDETESISDLLERESAVIDEIAVGKDGYLAIEFAGHPESTVEADVLYELDAYVPEDEL